MTCPRLIEVALPIREISAESVRDKSLRHGHISTLHLWWARRPLPACRAIVFASLVPDPDDPSCPAEFRDAVDRLLRRKLPDSLKGYFRGQQYKEAPDPYCPYPGIEDTPRNRLLTFIAKWSPEWHAFERGANDKQPKPGEMLDDRSLVKWETSNPESEQGREVLRIARELVRCANQGKMPSVLDPFAGGGAIPLEASRLGCQAIANDYNPVAYLILRATCEFPQRFGKPGVRKFPDIGESNVKNVLVHDVEYWAKWILERAREKIGHLYPPGKDKLPVVGYFFARTVPCSNPSCRAEIPMLRSMYLCNKSDKRVALTMEVHGKTTTFGIARGDNIKETSGTMLQGGDCRCPVCQQPTLVDDVRRAGVEGKIGERMVAVIVDATDGKQYRAVEKSDLTAFAEAKTLAKDVERPSEPIRPEVTSAEEHVSNRGDITVHLYGMKTWGSLFNPRQLLAMQTFTGCLREALTALQSEIPDAEYRQAVATYLGFWVSRNAARMTTVGRWHVSGEKLETPFDGARLPMKWDYPEANPFSDVTGGFANQLDWIVAYLQRDCRSRGDSLNLLGDSAHLPLSKAQVAAVVTDPPYFDEVAYADLSDFFYVWLKRGLADVIPDVLTTPQTPKADEATALKHRFGGSAEAADHHFTDKLSQIFTEARRVCDPNGVFTVIFAHQTKAAWSALVNSLFTAGLTIDATWPIEMELKNRVRGLNSAALETSIAVICRPRVAGSAGSFKQMRREIEEVVRASVQRFWDYGFRGADLIVACYGPAVGVFGRYERVERADGTLVGVPDLLDLAKDAALKAIAGEFTGDPLSRLYFVWTNLYGTSEQAWDDARLVMQVGGDSEDAMDVAQARDLFIVDGAKCRVALLVDRVGHRNLGDAADAPLIDQLHHAMHLWRDERRGELVSYLRDHNLFDQGPFWKLAQALFEVLPRDEADWKLVSALLGERETLRMEARRGVLMAAEDEPLPLWRKSGDRE